MSRRGRPAGVHRTRVRLSGIPTATGKGRPVPSVAGTPRLRRADRPAAGLRCRHDHQRNGATHPPRTSRGVRGLGELTVAAYHSLPGEMPHQQAYDERLRDVATRAGTSCVLVAVGSRRRAARRRDLRRADPTIPTPRSCARAEAGIRMLAVDPACQRRGVGRALTEACIERARAAGRRRIVLHTGEWMPAAKHLYESLGFERDTGLDFSPVPGHRSDRLRLRAGGNAP